MTAFATRGELYAGILAASAAEGLAVIDYSYNAEFNFIARMTTPVATPQTPADLAAWAKAHPNGLVVSSRGNPGPMSSLGSGYKIDKDTEVVPYFAVLE